MLKGEGTSEFALAPTGDDAEADALRVARADCEGVDAALALALAATDAEALAEADALAVALGKPADSHSTAFAGAGGAIARRTAPVTASTAV